MQCPKCSYEPTLSELQRSPHDCVKCGVNYESYEEQQAREAAEREARRAELEAIPLKCVRLHRPIPELSPSS